MKRTADIHLLLRLLNTAGLAVSLERTADCPIQLVLHSRNNPDGSVRWLWPAGAREAGCLRFYNAGSTKARLFTTIFETLFSAGLEKWLSQHTYIFYMSESAALQTGREWQNNFAIFTGTPGPNRKGVIWYREAERQFFIKVPLGETAAAILQHERQVLDSFNTANMNLFKVPEVASAFGSAITLTDIKHPTAKRVDQYSPLHQFALQQWYQGAMVCTVSELSHYVKTKIWLEQLADSDDQRLPKGLIRKLQYLFDSINPGQPVLMAPAHGDFTPWNMYVGDEALQVYDWELYIEKAPLLWDIFHFIFQSGILMHRQDATEILDKAEHVQAIWWHPGLDGSLLKQSLDLYLLMNTVYYLHIYAQQPKWHVQVSWLLKTWSLAISRVLHKRQILEQRQLLCMDLFDELQPHRYAALKWLSPLPEALSLNSDLDLCTHPRTLPVLKRFLQQHPFTAHVKTDRKTFMTTYTVVTTDAGILSIDAITKLKRKELDMLPATSVRKSASLSASGVKLPSVEIDFAYTWLFYVLNGASVPEKYRDRFIQLSERKGTSLNTWFANNWESTGISDFMRAFDNNEHLRSKVVEKIQSQRANKGLHRLSNRVGYWCDSLRSLLSGRGMLITFSGVDGAGKSTVIETIRQHLEKRFRKKVVVLRHRPSILPILSAWKHGKAAAEKLSVSNLPRQGKNKNRLSSLFRFCYYFIDYLLGQFYIHLKYVARGYIVLYDRYYFDFINDSRRSNIQLPADFTGWFYRFLIKPQLNFFLYASPEEIIKRKQELSLFTIKELTDKYLKLFNRLARKYRHSKYIPIHNDQLDSTVNTIVDHVKQFAS